VFCQLLKGGRGRGPKIMFMSFHFLKTYIRNPSLSLLIFSPSHLQGNADGNYDRRAYMCAGSWALPSWFAKLLKINFSYFAKIRWMPSWCARLLELLLQSHPTFSLHSWSTLYSFFFGLGYIQISLYCCIC
jgi:hypothetical protein